MGIPEHPHPRSSSAGGVFVVLAVLVVGGLLAVAALGVFGLRVFTVQSRQPATPMPMVYTMETKSEVDLYTPGAIRIELDQQGQITFNGEATSHEVFQTLLQNRMAEHGHLGNEVVTVEVEESCPSEELQKVLEALRGVGVDNPPLTSIPPRREVQVQLDQEGNPSIDGQATDDLLGVLQKIGEKYGNRATVVVQSHPRTPAEAVVRVRNLCQQARLGPIRLETTPTDSGDADVSAPTE